MLIYFHCRKEITYCFIFMIIHLIQKIIQNYLVTNNAKILYCTSQTDRCLSSNILNNKNKVRKT